MTPKERDTHIVYIKEGIDELKASKAEQWKLINQNVTDIAVLQEKSKSMARKSGGGAGGIAGLVTGLSSNFFVGLVKGWLGK